MFSENNAVTNGDVDWKEIGEKIFVHMQMIEYYRYLKEYDEGFASVFKHPKTIETKSEDASAEPEPELEVRFLKGWAARFEKAQKRNKLKKWNLDNFKCDKIAKSKFVELFLEHCIKVDDEDITFGGAGFFNKLLEVGKSIKIFFPNWGHPLKWSLLCC